MRPTIPVIGISTYSVHADWRTWRGDAALTPRTYLNCVVRAGGIPLLLPNVLAHEDAIGAMLDRVHGVVLIGGEDVCGVWSGREETDSQHAGHNDERDSFEVALARRSWERDIPRLGICRGAQVLNVSRGGTLIEDLPMAGASREHLIERGTFNLHEVDLSSGSRAERMYGTTTRVNSHHHQAVDRSGEGLTVTGRARDEVVEVIEGPERRFAIGVQWHPEESQDMIPFKELIEAAGALA